MEATKSKSVQHVPTYCYNCVSGPDFMTVKVVDGVATEVEPNFAAENVHPAKGRVCVKAYGLVQKTYNPNRILSPMKRINPKKGRDQDPGFVPISWDEAMNIVADKMMELRKAGEPEKTDLPARPLRTNLAGTALRHSAQDFRHRQLLLAQRDLRRSREDGSAPDAGFCRLS